MQSGSLEVFCCPPLPASLHSVRSVTLIMMGTPSCSFARFPHSSVCWYTGGVAHKELQAVPSPFIPLVMIISSADADKPTQCV